MAIPTAFDGQLGEIEDASSSVLIRLRTMHWAAEADVPAMRAALRDQLEAYVNLVMAAARSPKR
jgi:hypothetical protein